ncbi:MAG: NRDE family protein [Acidobacteriota bacterium]
MCTIAVLVGVTDLPLVIAANRDELYARPTRAPERLARDLVGGVDGLSGGTWLALHRRGVFAAVTNQRVMTPPLGQVKSRGLVVKELALAADQDAYVAALDPRAYASMNLVWGDADRVSVAYLRHEGGKEVIALPQGIHVLTNDRLGSPEFPRARHIADAIAAAPRDWPALAPALATILADHTHFEVPRRELSATCIHTPVYGTRSSTLAALDRGRVVHYLHADGPPCTTPYADRGGLLA